MEENKEFLQGYEMRTWDFSPRIYKIIASAAVFNLLFLTVIGQTNLLQAKACNSPLISKVCSVLDTVYVGSKLLSGNTDYVVKDYNRTEIGDADEVIFVDTTGATPQLNYPEGYFQVANRDELALLESVDDQFSTESTPFNNNPFPPANSTTPYTPPPPAPRIRNRSRRNKKKSVFSRKQNLPKKNKNAVVGNLPDDPFDTEDDGKTTDKKNTDKDVANNKNNEKANKTEKDLKDKTATNSKPVTDIEINKKPLQDFADKVIIKVSKKELDLAQPFMLRMTGEIDTDGKIVRKKSSFSEQKGNQKMIDVAKSAIEAVGDSGWLNYLSRYDVNKINMVLAQDQSQFFAVVVSQLPNQERANSVATGLRSIIQAALLADKNGWRKLGDDEKALLKSATISSEGKSLKINFNMEKPIAQEMIKRKITEEIARKQKEQNSQPDPKKPNGVKENKTANDAAGK